VWVVHPRSETVTEYRSPEVIRLLQRGDELRAEDLLPGFAYPLEELFAPLG
jgi:Uma2 family endonuclease